jgi:hypothetical protein
MKLMTAALSLVLPLQLLLSGVTCFLNQAVVHGGCLSVLRSKQVAIAGSNFTYNTVSAQLTQQQLQQH